MSAKPVRMYFPCTLSCPFFSSLLRLYSLYGLQVPIARVKMEEGVECGKESVRAFPKGTILAFTWWNLRKPWSGWSAAWCEPTCNPIANWGTEKQRDALPDWSTDYREGFQIGNRDTHGFESHCQQSWHRLSSIPHAKARMVPLYTTSFTHFYISAWAIDA